MSAVGASSSDRCSRPPFLILPSLAWTGAKSATAAAISSTSQAGNSRSQASRSCCALTRSTRLTPAGAAERHVGAQQHHLGARGAGPPAASASPIRPEELLPMKRTLSIASRVPPAVTSTLVPASDPPAPSAPSAPRAGRPRRPPAGARARPSARCRARRRRRAGRRWARAPRTPRERSVCRFCWVAGCSYMREFIAGATSSGQPAARAQLREQVVGQARGELGDRVGRRGSDQEQLGVGHQLEVAERVVVRRALVGERPAGGIALELADQHRRPGQRGERGRADEAAAGGGLHDAHARGRRRSPGGRTRAPCTRRSRR